MIREAKNVKKSKYVERKRGGCWIKYEPSNILGPHNIPPRNYEANMVVPEDKPEGDNWFWHPNENRPNTRA